MRFPDNVDQLITELDSKFPEAVYDPSEGIDAFKHRSSQRSVILFLKHWRASAAAPPPAPRTRAKGRAVST